MTNAVELKLVPKRPVDLGQHQFTELKMVGAIQLVFRIEPLNATATPNFALEYGRKG